MRLLDSFLGIAIEFFSGVLGGCLGVTREFWVVAMMLLRWFQEVLVLLRHCKAVAKVLCIVTRVFLVVARALLCQC